MPIPLNILGAGLGAIEAIAGNVSSSEGNKYRRFKEKGVDEAERQTMADRERILSATPATNAKMKQMAIQNAGAQGLAVAGNAGGSAANSGMAGGDVSAPALQGAKASQYTGQVAAQTGGQLAQTYDQMAQEQANQNQQLMQNTKDKAQIADMVTYQDEGKDRGAFAGILGGAFGGANVLTSLAKLGMPSDEEIIAKDRSQRIGNDALYSATNALGAMNIGAQGYIPTRNGKVPGSNPFYKNVGWSNY